MTKTAATTYPLAATDFTQLSPKRIKEHFEIFTQETVVKSKVKAAEIDCGASARAGSGHVARSRQVE
jgi:hypothetical protein